MTHRSIQSGQHPTVIVRAGGDVRIEGCDSDRVVANTGAWGLKLERRDEGIEVQMGGSGEVSVPRDSTVKVYAGKTADIQNIEGSVAVYVGGNVHMRNVDTLIHASAGGGLDFECERVEGDNVKFAAGRDVRCCIRRLSDTKLMVNDLGGYWEGIIGSGYQKIRLTAGGDVTLVTDQEIITQPPHYVLGKIERPVDATSKEDAANKD